MTSSKYDYKSQISRCPSHSVDQNRHRHGHSKRNLGRLRIVQRYFVSRHPQTEQGRQQMRDVHERLPLASLPDNHGQRHYSRNQNCAYEHGEQLPRTETGSQGASQFPVSGAEAADQYERQQQAEAQQRPQQRGLQSRPAVENHVDRDAGRQAGHCEPVRNSPVAPVENSRTHRQQRRRNPWPRLYPWSSNPWSSNPWSRLKHDCCRQTSASAHFASCTVGLSQAALKGEVLGSQSLDSFFH